MPETLEEQVNSVKSALAKDRNLKSPPDDDPLLEDFEIDDEEAASASASLKFGDDIKLLLISSTPLRVICHFLGVNGVSDVKNAPFQSIPMIAFLLQERLTQFMKSKGYVFAGEIAFDQNGNPIPVSKHAWNLRGDEISFTNSGYMFYDAGTGRTKDNVVMNVFTQMGEVKAGIQCYAETGTKAKKLMNELESFAKKDNCIRGAKLRDVNMATATFHEVVVTGKYTWDNYYFPKPIRDMFDLEVFGFVKNTEKYNAKGITKRGIMMFGPPGCVLAETRIRVRKVSDKGSHPVHIV